LYPPPILTLFPYTTLFRSYRTLKLLKAGGLVDELDLMHYGGDQHYYETRLKPEHAHVICLRCGKVEEFFGEPLQRLRKQIESHLDRKSTRLNSSHQIISYA